MANFSPTSLKRLATCQPELQRLFLAVIEEFDCTILCGHRPEREQMMAYDAGTSKLKWPLSRHNSLPSQAIDVAPSPIDWSNIARFGELAAVVKRKAKELGIEVEWGGEIWPTFKDYPHWQLKKKR